MQTVGMKRCTRCRKLHPRSAFDRMTASPDGLQYNCRRCKQIYNTRRYAKKKTQIKAQNKAYRAANPTVFPTFKRRYYEAHKEQYKIDLRRWRTANWRGHYVNWLCAS